jgi:hypothetical protein
MLSEGTHMSKSPIDVSDFDRFVKSQQPSPMEEAFNWQEQRDEWITHLNDLYDKIQKYLERYISSKEIKLEFTQINLNEVDIGSYIVPQMTLVIGRKKIVFNPIGTMLVGAKGRVDVVGPAGKTRLVLVDSDAVGPRAAVRPTTGHAAKLVWKIVTPPPSIGYIELTQDSFFQAVMEVANG